MGQLACKNPHRYYWNGIPLNDINGNRMLADTVVAVA
jgi:hypothetical protein